MNTDLLKTIQNFKITSHKRRCSDIDFIDRLNDFYSPIILTLFSIIICTKSYIVGEPLQCWVPVHFSDGWEKYSESYCFIKNTYYFPPNVKDIPNDPKIRTENELQYYQWIPFVLGLQAALFLIPAFFWRTINWQSRIHLKSIIERAVLVTFKSGEERQKTIASIAEHIHISLFRTTHLHKKSKLKKLKHSSQKKCFGLGAMGYFLIMFYLLTKLLFIGNIIIQFFILKGFLRADLFYGVEMAKQFNNGSDWQKTGLFPRVTLCDFTMAKKAQSIPYTIQCVLVNNLLNEKIYLFIWFWFAFLFIVNIASSFYWLLRMLLFGSLHNLYSKTELVNDKIRTDQLYRCEKDMTIDATFTLQMIETNCGKLTTKAIISNLIDMYSYASENNLNGTLSKPPPYQDTVSKPEEKSEPIDDTEMQQFI